MLRALNISKEAEEVKGNFTFTKIPNRLLKLELSDGAKLTLQHLLKRDFGGRGYVLASARSLAGERRKSVRSLQRHLHELKERGFISVRGRRIFIHYERLGKLPFLKVPNALFSVKISDGSKLTFEALLLGGRVGELYRVLNKAECTIRRHLRELEAAGLIQRLGLRALISYERLGLEVDKSGAPGATKMTGFATKMAAQAVKNVAALEPKTVEKPDQVIHSTKSPSAEEDYTKTKYIDDYYVPVVIQHPVLRAFVESPRESRRRGFLIEKFGGELVNHALRQADLQYRHSPTQIKNVFGLLYAMLAHGLDDTLLRQKEQEEAERRRRERERRLRQEQEERLFRHLCEHPEVWMERYVVTQGRLAQLRAQYDGDLSRVIAEQYGGAIRRFVIPDLLYGGGA